MADYYVVAVEENGDVMAVRAELTERDGLSITVRTFDGHRDAAFENQGGDPTSQWESARDALASIMPDGESHDCDPLNCDECAFRLSEDIGQ